MRIGRIVASLCVALASAWVTDASSQIAPSYQWRAYGPAVDASSALRLPPSLAVVDESATLVDGDIPLGAPFLRISVRHRHSGRLTEDLVATGLPYGRTKKVLAPAGTYVFQWRFAQRDTTQIGEGLFGEGPTLRFHQYSDAFLMCGISSSIDFALWKGDGFCVAALTPRNTLTSTTFVMDSVGREAKNGLGVPSAFFPMLVEEAAKQQSAFVWEETGEAPPKVLSVEAAVTKWETQRLELAVVGVDGSRRTLLSRLRVPAEPDGTFSLPLGGRQIGLASAQPGIYRARQLAAD